MDIDENGWAIALVLQAGIFVMLMRRAGFPGWLGMFMAIPWVNLGIAGWFVLVSRFVPKPLVSAPSRRDRSAMRDRTWENTQWLKRILCIARQGHHAESRRQLSEWLHTVTPHHPLAAFAQQRFNSLAKPDRMITN